MVVRAGVPERGGRRGGRHRGGPARRPRPRAAGHGTSGFGGRSSTLRPVAPGDHLRVAPTRARTRPRATSHLDRQPGAGDRSRGRRSGAAVLVPDEALESPGRHRRVYVQVRVVDVDVPAEERRRSGRRPGVVDQRRASRGTPATAPSSVHRARAARRRPSAPSGTGRPRPRRARRARSEEAVPLEPRPLVAVIGSPSATAGMVRLISFPLGRRATPRPARRVHSVVTNTCSLSSR